MRYFLENQELAVQVDSLGAELKSLKDRKTGLEYMWQADPAYWKRTSPVLFPLVGNYKDKKMRYQGKTYSMSQHGFARDMEFRQEEEAAGAGETAGSELWLFVTQTPQTLESYPFPFRLSVGYRLEGRCLRVLWRVENTGSGAMHFSIGGHPAFNCPLREGEKRSDCSIGFGGTEEVVSTMIGDDGLASDTKLVYELRNGRLPVTDNLFDHDALVIEGDQTHEFTLAGADGKPYVTVRFDAPLFGVWSQPKMDAPFVCVEPWYGRCDHTDFAGTLEEREWGNTLQAGETFEASYTIAI